MGKEKKKKKDRDRSRSRDSEDMKSRDKKKHKDKKEEQYSPSQEYNQDSHSHKSKKKEKKKDRSNSRDNDYDSNFDHKHSKKDKKHKRDRSADYSDVEKSSKKKKRSRDRDERSRDRDERSRDREKKEHGYHEEDYDNDYDYSRGDRRDQYDDRGQYRDYDNDKGYSRHENDSSRDDRRGVSGGDKRSDRERQKDRSRDGDRHKERDRSRDGDRHKERDRSRDGDRHRRERSRDRRRSGDDWRSRDRYGGVSKERSLLAEDSARDRRREEERERLREEERLRNEVDKKKREARQKESLRDEQRQKALDEELERKAEKFKARRRSEPEFDAEGFRRIDDDGPDDTSPEDTEDSPQNIERRRRLKNSEKMLSSDKYIQDYVRFLWWEAKESEEIPYFSWKKESAESEEISVKLDLGGEIVKGSGCSIDEGCQVAAKLMMSQIGPYIEDREWQDSAADLKSGLPQQFAESWQEPIFDARHVPMTNRDGAPLKGESGSPQYEVEAKYGPFTCISIADNLNTSLSSLIKHFKNFLQNQDLQEILDRPETTDLEEMEVSKEFNQPYVQGPGIIEVRLEGPNHKGQNDLILPAMDVCTVQKHLRKGKFPPSYGSQDTWNCIKTFHCTRCMTRMNGTESLLKHVKNIKHWRKIGKIFLNNQLLQTFNPTQDPVLPHKKEEETDEEKTARIAAQPIVCANCEEEDRNEFATGHCKECDDYLCTACQEAHKKTRLTKNHEILLEVAAPEIKHPKKDEEMGVKVEKDNIKYLIAVYRSCTNKLKSKAFAPPPVQEEGDYGNMYEGEDQVEGDVAVEAQGEGEPQKQQQQGQQYQGENGENWDETPEGMGQMGLPSMAAKEPPVAENWDIYYQDNHGGEGVEQWNQGEGGEQWGQGQEGWGGDPNQQGWYDEFGNWVDPQAMQQQFDEWGNPIPPMGGPPMGFGGPPMGFAGPPMGGPFGGPMGPPMGGPMGPPMGGPMMGGPWGPGPPPQFMGGRGGWRGNRGAPWMDRGRGGPWRGRGGPPWMDRGRGGPWRGGFDRGGWGGPRGRGNFRGRGGQGGFNEMPPPNQKNFGAENKGSLTYDSKGYGYEANADQLRKKKKVEQRTDLSKLAAGGEDAVKDLTEDSTGEDGNTAYTGMLGKSGFSDKNKKIVKKFAALPPPGHEQWDNIEGNENMYEEEIEAQPIMQGIDNSIAHIRAVGQDFKANKLGVKPCIMWKRGMCKFGDRCIYNHAEVIRGKAAFQNAVDMNIAPDEKDKFGYRIAKQNPASQGAPVQDRTLDDTTDWYNSESTNINLNPEEMEAINKSIKDARSLVGHLETDFTKEPKKKSRWE